MVFSFRIGDVELTNYLTRGGIVYSIVDVSVGDVVTIDGSTHLGNVSQKEQFELTFRALTTAELAIVLPVLHSDYIECTYLSPELDRMVIKNMIKTDERSVKHLAVEKGVDIWEGLAVTLRER